MGVLSLEPFGRGSSISQGQPLLILGLRPLGKNYKVICSWFALVLVLETLGRDYAVSQDQLPLVPGFGPFGGHYSMS